ncbi:MAG: methyltransferase domain-containing protein [Pyrinomonadaceae bacterium]|nr:methyltransferase domain-containing protein [Pyrinomonadaceae bacterium]
MKAKRIMTERAFQNLFGNVQGGSFTIRHKDGKEEIYGDGKPLFTIVLKSENVLDLVSGDMLMTFGKAYMEGRVDVKGDLADLISLAIQNGLMSAVHRKTETRLVTPILGRFRSQKREKKNIAHHYDIGNDFFGLWLDDSLTYSCGYFQNVSDTIEQAQLQKIEHSLRKLRLKPNESVLDIGCGWGSVVIRAAEQFGARATGITLSQEQIAGASDAIVSRRLQDKADVRLMDYAALAKEGQKFDKVVSIGMIEHVGKEHLAEFIDHLENLLKPGGLALLHFITAVNEGPINGWIEKNIFPGGYIPTLSEIVARITDRDFRVWDVENLAPHYRMTLDHWSERFENAVPSVLERFDEKFVRMWRLYLRVSSAAFKEGEVEVHQILVSRGKPVNLPLTRDDLYRSESNVEHKSR